MTSYNKHNCISGVTSHPSEEKFSILWMSDSGRAQYLSFIFDVTINDLLYVFHHTTRRSTLHVLLVEDSKKFRGEDFFFRILIAYIGQDMEVALQ